MGRQPCTRDARLAAFWVQAFACCRLQQFRDYHGIVASVSIFNRESPATLGLKTCVDAYRKASTQAASKTASDAPVNLADAESLAVTYLLEYRAKAGLDSAWCTKWFVVPSETNDVAAFASDQVKRLASHLHSAVTSRDCEYFVSGAAKQRQVLNFLSITVSAGTAQSTLLADEGEFKLSDHTAVKGCLIVKLVATQSISNASQIFDGLPTQSISNASQIFDGLLSPASGADRVQPATVDITLFLPASKPVAAVQAELGTKRMRSCQQQQRRPPLADISNGSPPRRRARGGAAHTLPAVVAAGTAPDEAATSQAIAPLQKRSGNTPYHTYRNRDTGMLISDASCPAELATERSLQPGQTWHGCTVRTVQRQAQQVERLHPHFCPRGL